jgi:hypothetical protein
MRRLIRRGLERIDIRVGYSGDERNASVMAQFACDSCLSFITFCDGSAGAAATESPTVRLE